MLAVKGNQKSASVLLMVRWVHVYDIGSCTLIAFVNVFYIQESFMKNVQFAQLGEVSLATLSLLYHYLIPKSKMDLIILSLLKVSFYRHMEQKQTQKKETWYPLQ